METEVLSGWHFVSKDRKLSHEDGRLVKAGRTYKLRPGQQVAICKCGFHVSKTIREAFLYNYFVSEYRPILCRVEVGGNLEYSGDVICGSYRKVLWTMNIEHILIKFVYELIEDMFNTSVFFGSTHKDELRLFMEQSKEHIMQKPTQDNRLKLKLYKNRYLKQRTTVSKLEYLTALALREATSKVGVECVAQVMRFHINMCKIITPAKSEFYFAKLQDERLTSLVLQAHTKRKGH